MEKSTNPPPEEINKTIREFKECENKIFSIFGNNIEKVDLSLMGYLRNEKDYFFNNIYQHIRHQKQWNTNEELVETLQRGIELEKKLLATRKELIFVLTTMDITDISSIHLAMQSVVPGENRVSIPSEWKEARHERELKNLGNDISSKFIKNLDAIACVVEADGGKLSTHGDLARFWAEKGGSPDGSTNMRKTQMENIRLWIKNNVPNVGGIGNKTIVDIEDFLREEGDI